MSSRKPESHVKTPAPQQVVPLPQEQPWYIVGLPGSGKSRLGQALAAELGTDFTDIDRVVEGQQAQSISTIFQQEGEEHFRRLEARAIIEGAGKPSPGIISVGGGAVETAEVREFLKSQTVIWVDAADAVLLGRIKRTRRRPLMRDNPEKQLRKLRDRRTPLYEEVATVRVRSTKAPVTRVVDQVLGRLLDWQRIRVRGGAGPYSYVSGFGCTNLLAAAIPDSARQAFIVVPEALSEAARKTEAALQAAGLTVHTFVHPEGEAAKDLTVAEQAWDAMGQARIGRTDVVVPVGGGATTDLGGFLAATWLRGVAVIQLPTSLLAMVDAAVGGKTGINTRTGKNLVGAFHDPALVLADLSFLETLPQEEYTSGLAEIIKAGFIKDPQILTLIERNPQIASVQWAAGPGRGVLSSLIAKAVRVKAQVVGQDRLEAGQRETLNYGHTLGHAIERADSYRTRHGDAVAMGSVFAAMLAEDLGLISPELRERHQNIFATVGLPTDHRGDFAVLLDAMRSDKKTRGDSIRFALLTGTGKAEVRPVPVRQLASTARRYGLTVSEEEFLRD